MSGARQCPAGLPPRTFSLTIGRKSIWDARGSPRLLAALDYVRDGDVLIVRKIDCLDHSLLNLIETVTSLDQDALRSGACRRGRRLARDGYEPVLKTPDGAC